MPNGCNTICNLCVCPTSPVSVYFSLEPRISLSHRYSILGEGGDREGIIPRFCNEMFAVAQERLDEDATLGIKISMSYVEIYNEKVRDLLEKRRKGELTALGMEHMRIDIVSEKL